LGGSADLTPSNNTKAKNQIEIRPGEYKGSYVHYGVREHGMAATMNGIALHGGLIPYGGTFLCFSDYCRPAIRLAAMMDIRTIFVMTHDSIGLGEDGPTHQPIEHLSSLRAIPHLAVFRPGDPVETAECWEIILDNPRRAALLALSRQPMPLLRREAGMENRSARGAYVLIEAEDGPRKVTLMATGSELRLAVEARAVLQQEGIPTAVRAVHLDLQRAGCGIPAGGAWRHPSPGGGRGCSADELGSLPRLAGVLCRHARVRRIREDLPMSTRSSTSPPKRWCAPPARV
jgi:transketolase